MTPRVMCRGSPESYVLNGPNASRNIREHRNRVELQTCCSVADGLDPACRSHATVFDQLFADSSEMDLIRTITDADEARVDIGARKERVLRDAGGAVDLDGAVDDARGHAGPTVFAGAIRSRAALGAADQPHAMASVEAGPQ